MVVTFGVSEVRQRLDVPPGMFQVSVQIPVMMADYSGPATVSVSDLKVPGKARNEEQKAEQNIARKPDDARKELTKALELDPKYGKAHMLMGILNLMQRRIKEATRELEAAIQYDPGNARAFLALASAYNTEQRYPDAVRALDSGTRLAPAAWQTYFEMSRARLGMKDFKAALEQATKAEGLCPEDNPDIHTVKASALIGLRDYPHATDELEKFLHLAPEGPQAAEARRTLDQLKAVDTARK
jgi:tetratricopeptide (TPR) repeat protein